jgi:bacillithiol biosynthesis cysteine-adding enzyme BshC
MPELYADYLAGASALRPFFAHGVRDLSAAGAGLPAWGAGMRDGLVAYQAQLGLARDIAPGSLAVVTGQQPGLLTGPLYTIYKAITAIKLARRAAEATGRPAVPVFWAAADDHDFEEVRGAQLLTQEHTALALRYDPVADIAAYPMHEVPLETSLHALIDQAADAATGSEFAAEVRAFLHGSLEQSRSFSGWFCHIMARLFRDTPLLIFTTEMPAARVAAAPIFAREISTPLESTRLLNAAGARLAALGYGAQVVKADDECAFFLMYGPRRRKVLYRADRFVVPEESQSFSQGELLALLSAQPERFSANVALRPIVQQQLFPALAYVGGPGEIAYWAQFRDVFAHFGQPMPIVYPRAQATLTTIKLNKLLAKYGFTAAGLAQPREALLQHALESSVKSPALDTFRAGRSKVEGAADELRAALLAVKKLDRPSADAAGAATDQIRAALDRLEKQLLRADSTQTETARKQVDRLCNTLAPDRKPQERVFTVFSFLFEHGWGLIDCLTESIDTDSFTMNEIEL